MMAARPATAEGVLDREELRQGLQVEGLSHRFGRRQVVDSISLAVPAARIHCLVGPSGCGKTTTLRLIAGLEEIQAGRIAIDGRVVAAPEGSLPPERRRVGLMFQDFALFPHLRVDENVAFGISGLDRKSRQGRIDELLGRVNMLEHARDYPHTLSGGEQQRVALARALAPRPALMLLDEAFSALDAALRSSVREETLGVLKETGTPTLLVTHDADEAIRVADCIHAMQAGRIVQSGAPAELYARPASPFVAGFFGAVNRFAAVVRRGRAGTPVGEVDARGMPDAASVEIVIRPEGVGLREAAGAGPRRARILEHRDLGPVHMLTLGLPDGSTITVRRSEPPTVKAGDEVEIALDPAHVFVYPATA
jgi:iron(III) transport system ATP-binding protein